MKKSPCLRPQAAGTPRTLQLTGPLIVKHDMYVTPSPVRRRVTALFHWVTPLIVHACLWTQCVLTQTSPLKEFFFEKSDPRRKKKKIQRAPNIRLVFYLDYNTGCCHVVRICLLCQLNKAENLFLLHLLYHDLSTGSSGKSREKKRCLSEDADEMKRLLCNGHFWIVPGLCGGVLSRWLFIFCFYSRVFLCENPLLFGSGTIHTLWSAALCNYVSPNPVWGRTNPIVSQSIHPFIYFTAPIISTASPDIYLLFFTSLNRWESLQLI